LRNIEDTELGTDLSRRDKEFRLRLLNKGVYTIRGGGAVSMAHTDQDLQKIIRAVDESAAEMAMAQDKA
jgi:glutamate-1-semialdehyde 2,1-aminomutase